MTVPLKFSIGNKDYTVKKKSLFLRSCVNSSRVFSRCVRLGVKGGVEIDFLKLYGMHLYSRRI